MSDLDVYVLKEHEEVLAATGREWTAGRGDLPDPRAVWCFMFALVGPVRVAWRW